MAEVVHAFNEYAAATNAELRAQRLELARLRATFLELKEGLQDVAASLVKTDFSDLDEHERKALMRRRTEYASVGGNIARAARKYDMETGDWRDLCDWTQEEGSPASRKLEAKLRRYSVGTVKQLWEEFQKDRHSH